MSTNLSFSEPQVSLFQGVISQDLPFQPEISNNKLQRVNKQSNTTIEPMIRVTYVLLYKAVVSTNL